VRDPSGHEGLAELTVVSGISGLITGLVSAATAKSIHGGAVDAFFRGFISGTVSTALILGLEGRFPPSAAFGIGNGIGDIVVDVAEGHYSHPGDAAVALLKTLADVVVGAAAGASFGALFPEAADISAARVLQILQNSTEAAGIRAAAQDLSILIVGVGVTGFTPAVIDKTVDWVADSIKNATRIIKSIPNSTP
jgi:hypothetical protein